MGDCQMTNWTAIVRLLTPLRETATCISAFAHFLKWQKKGKSFWGIAARSRDGSRLRLDGDIRGDLIIQAISRVTDLEKYESTLHIGIEEGKE